MQIAVTAINTLTGERRWWGLDECSCSTDVVIVSAAPLTLVAVQTNANDGISLRGQTGCMPITHPAPPFHKEACFLFASHHFTDMTHTSLFFSSLLFVFFFLNSSLFCAHVYFYPSVHGRSQRNDEAWETCSSPWQLYSKPSFPNAAFITTSHTSVALILLSQLSGMFFHIFSSGGFSHIHDSSPRLPPPQTEPPLASLNQRACCCNSVLTHVSWLCVWMPFVSSPLWGPLPCGWKSLWALCSSRGVSPSPTHPPPPPLPLFYWVLLRNANLLTSFPFNNCSMAPSFKTGAELLPFDYNFNYNQF